MFFDKSKKHDKVILIDASQLGEEYKDGNNQRTRLRQDEIDLIVNTFINSKEVDEFSAVVTYEDIKAKGYTLGAGQYFDIKIDHIDISEEEFNSSISTFMSNINSMQKESERLTEEMNELITKIGL